MVDAECVYTRTGEGLHRFVDPVDGEVYLYTQFETADAQRMYACFDQPDLKAHLRLHGDRARDWEVVSNGGREDSPGDGGAQDVAVRARRRRCRRTSPRSSRGRTTSARQPRRHRLGVYCRASLAEHLDADEMFPVTKQGFDCYHRAFGYRYPFDKYDQLFVPEFNAGAMENAGAGDLPRGLRLPLEGDRRTPTSGAPRRSCTRWRTCGSATSSRCAGGTTSG